MAKTEKLWGGRFTGETDPTFARFNQSLSFDWRLLEADVRGSLAYCDALVAAAVLTGDEGEKIREALKEILSEVNDDPVLLSDADAEDVHTFVEQKLVAKIGDAGRKLHTGRSRNDQVTTDLRIWLRDAIDHLAAKVRDTQKAFLTLAEVHVDTILPGYTHLQRAQPVRFSHWCLAYFEMLLRDGERLREVRARVNVLPLGSAALAGTAFPIDREALAQSLGFEIVSSNSLDAVSDRDFCVEFTNACALIMVHLSRLAEEMILYSSSEFGFFELSDAVATGSSLMPQKKNPDSMELVRGKVGRVFGHHVSLLSMLKGLPLAYNKDMQEDKEAVFDSFDTTSDSLIVTELVLRNLEVKKDRMLAAASSGYMNATEMADYLARKGVPFRQAHEIVGRAISVAIAKGVELQELPMDELRSISKSFEEDVFEVLNLEKTVESKSQIGGTSKAQVTEAIKNARKRLG